jgi:DNA repair protein RadC
MSQNQEDIACVNFTNDKPIRKEHSNLQYNIAELQVKFNIKIRPSERKRISRVDDAYEVFLNIWSEDIDYLEEFVVLFLDNANAVIAYKKFFKGGRMSCAVDYGVVLQAALLCGSTSVIIAHNHPGGICKPSLADNNLTKAIYQAGAIIGISLFDHLIISSEGYYSYMDSGKMDIVKNEDCEDYLLLHERFKKLKMNYSVLVDKHIELQKKLLAKIDS